MNYYDDLTIDNSNFLKYINNKLEIDSTDSEKNIDEQTVEKLIEIWNELDDNKNFDNFFDFTTAKEKDIYREIIQNVIYNNEYEMNKYPIDLFNNEDIEIFKNVLLQYITNIKKIDHPENLIQNNDKSILMTVVWLVMGIWWQSLTSTIKYSPALCFICLSYIFVDHYFDDVSIKKKDKKQFAEYCYRRLFIKIKPYDLFSNKIDQVMTMMENEYSKEKFLLTYNRLVYLYNIEMKSMKMQSKISKSSYEYLQLTVEKGYSTLDTMMYLIYINNPEEIDQHKQNFFSLFGLFIQMADDLLDLKNDIKQKNYTYLCKLVLSKSINNIDFYINKLCNLIKIMFKYLERSNTIIENNKELTLKRFKLFSVNILAYGVLKNKDLTSPSLVEYYKNIYLLKENDIKNMKSDLISNLKKIFI